MAPIVAVFAVVVLLGLGIAPRVKQQRRLSTEAAAVRNDPAPVNAVSPQYEPSTTLSELPGNVNAIDDMTVNARTSGYIVKRYVDIGDHVRAGEVLAEIEAPEVDQQYLQAKAQASQASAGDEQAQAEVAHLQANVSQAVADTARTQSSLEAAKADVAHSQAKLLEAQSALSQANAEYVGAQKNLGRRRADMRRAQAEETLAHKTWVRWQQLAKGGAVSGQELDETQAAYQASQATVESAAADVESAQADVDAARAGVKTREGDVQAAQADVAASQQNVSAQRAAVASSRANVTAAKARVWAGKANVQAAQAGIEANVANVSRYQALRGFERVVAPFSGVITARNVDVGDLINAGSSGTVDPTSTVPHVGLFGIARTDYMRVQVNVPQSEASPIHIGQMASVRVQERPGRVFTGRVTWVSGALDASSRTLLTEVRVPNPDGLLVPGMYAQVGLVGRTEHPLLQVPAGALVIDSSGTRVVEIGPEDRAHFVSVTLGRDFGRVVEITGGLQPHARLISNPPDDLTEGARVKVVPAAD